MEGSSFQPRWLKIKRAAEYSAIGKQRLIKLAADGRIVGFQDPDSKRGDWIFDRLSLDEYRKEQAGTLAIEAAVLALTGELEV